MTGNDYYARADRAAGWLAGSGIQIAEGEHSGGVYSWYDIPGKRYGFVYSEIAGYYMTTMMHLAGKRPDDAYVKSALSAYNWLASVSRHGQAFRCRYLPDSRSFLPHLCSFDNGMILNGLCSLYRQVKRDDVLERAVSCGDWLVGSMQRDDGTFLPKFDVNQGKPLNSQESWSTQDGAYHVKLTIGLLNLADITGEKRYGDAARRAAEHTLGLQGKDGRFVTNQRLGDTYMHPQCYAIEGLWTAGRVLEEQKFLDGALLGGEWVLRAARKCGFVPKSFADGAFSSDIHVDSSSQAIRMFLLLSDSGMKRPLDVKKSEIEEMTKTVLGYQHSSDDARGDGAFLYGMEGGETRVHANAHATMFMLQTLLMLGEWEERGEVKPPLFTYV